MSRSRIPKGRNKEQQIASVGMKRNQGCTVDLGHGFSACALLLDAVFGSMSGERGVGEGSRMPGEASMGVWRAWVSQGWVHAIALGIVQPEWCDGWDE